MGNANSVQTVGYYCYSPKQPCPYVHVDNGNQAITELIVQQTYSHFKEYASQHHPRSEEAQNQIIKQMQSELIQNYTNDVCKSMQQHRNDQIEQMQTLQQCGKIPNIYQLTCLNYITAKDHQDLSEGLGVPILWTVNNIEEFKKLIRANDKSMLRIHSGESYTIRVPIHPNGKSVYWEFATDNHDLGFGLSFEWIIPINNAISIDLNDYSDEEFDDEVKEDIHLFQNTKISNDLEIGEKNPEDNDQKSKNLVIDDLIPLFRRDCHMSTVCGYHKYPGVGYYHFKFDNTYSFWRSKTLYFRFYYCVQ
ncbi:hypothetical protein GJ496_003389 [Pomphorhynchus laevis]|nr:hypothetical protein GJ496_003389 [Pomphorhynchus laevis]